MFFAAKPASLPAAFHQGVVPEMGIICKTSGTLSTASVKIFLFWAEKSDNRQKAGAKGFSPANRTVSKRLLRNFQSGR